MSLAPTQWRQVALITAGAAAVFAALRLLPTGSDLSHMDFRTDPKSGQAIEFCDPANPQFIPVVAVRSPVTMSVTPGAPAIVRLRTANGKPLRPEDLLVTHTERLHLLIIDPTLRDYQHVHPQPAGPPGEWRFDFAPRLTGAYRIFADFTPAATGRGLYASADMAATGEPAAVATTASPGREAVRAGHHFALTTAPAVPRAAQPITLRFEIARADGGAVALQPVMGALAHLVAFDQARSGFAHLHPVEPAAGEKSDAAKPVLDFKLTIPRAGRFTVWAQVNLDGRETFVPFGIEVAE
ncbi:MAG: hypothetical protein JNL39_19080 [Opitutaceae bacterium]|nr:hypothetical protein [Opitutaceae bacterium]